MDKVIKHYKKVLKNEYELPKDDSGYESHELLKFKGRSLYEKYIKKINNIPNQLFTLYYFDWDNANTSFQFFYPKIGGKCRVPKN